MRLGPPPEVEEEPGQFWKDFIRDTAPVFRKPTIEQLEEFIAPTFAGALRRRALRRRAAARDLRRARSPTSSSRTTSSGSRRSRPAGGRWVRIVSCNPLELQGSGAAARVLRLSRRPTATGGTRSARSTGARIADLHGSFDEFCRERGAPPLPGLEFIHESPYLNLYVYPDEVDYARARPLAPTWHRLDSSVRDRASRGSCPTTCASGDGALVYLSLGSLGSADVELMQRSSTSSARRAAPLDRLEGPAADQIEPADNMWGEEFLPQPAILPPGRPRDHARRQQHDHRVLPPRQADGRAAALLGSVRQRAADRRDRARGPALDLRVRGRRADRRRRPPARRRRAARRASTAMARRLQASSGTVAAAGLIERLAA